MKVVSSSVLSGLGRVRISPDGKLVKVLLTRREKQGENWVELRETLQLLRANCPALLTQEGLYQVRVTATPGNDREMLSLYPADGVFTAKFLKFLSPPGGGEDAPPAPVVKEGKFGRYETFMALVEIVEGPFAGAQVPVYLSYNFKAYTGEDGKVYAGYSKNLSKSEPTVYLHSFFYAIGIDDDVEVPYSDNILPNVQRFVLNKAKQFDIVLNSGKVVEFRDITSPDANWGDGEWSSTPEPSFDEDTTPPWDNDQVDADNPMGFIADEEDSPDFSDDNSWE